MHAGLAAISGVTSPGKIDARYAAFRKHVRLTGLLAGALLLVALTLGGSLG